MPISLTDTDATLPDKRWQEQADLLATQGLPQIRGTATAWTATIGALTSLFGLSLIIKGRSDLSGLDTGTGIAVGVLSLFAIGVAVVAIYLGALAAQGTPAVLWDSGPKLRDWSLSEASLASSRLRASRILIVVGLLFLLASIGVDWYGPGKPPPASYVLAVSHKSGIVCGQVNSSDGTVAITPADKSQSVVRIKASDLISATVVQKCP